ncbi:hypothetical protein B0H14DRAFT_3487719 [Mycena olivaceomarginata]|nr:hypothetical protein B0H14DRAFT_3487719 [Mycena olivaceomarginata]
MTEVPLTLDAIATSNQALNQRLDMLNTRLDGLQREAAINGNIAKGTGLRIPYNEVLFLDGSQPTVATAAVPAQGAQPARPGHPILPLLSNVAAIRNLTGPDATHYLIGYGIAQIPHLVQERQDPRRLPRGRLDQTPVGCGSNNTDSEYFYGNYRSEKYIPLTSNRGFMDPPIPQTINGVVDTYSYPFLDDFGNGSEAVTNFTASPFAGKDLVLVSNGICASTCSIFSSYLFQKHGVRSAVSGGTPNSTTAQFDGDIKGSEVTDLDAILFELGMTGLKNDTAAPQPLPISTSLSLNFRNAILYTSKKYGILEYVWEQGTKKYQFTREQYNNPQKIWEFMTEEFFGGK